MSYPLTATESTAFKAQMRTVPDFPKPGVQFKDVSTLLRDPKTMSRIYEAFAAKCETLKPDYLVMLEARGFLLAPVASLLEVGTVMVRKPKKLPGDIVTLKYELEYGSDELSIQTGMIGGQPRHRRGRPPRNRWNRRSRLQAFGEHRR